MEGEGEFKQPSHSVTSQKGTYVNKKSNTSLLAPSQKGVNIEKVLNQGHMMLAKDYL